MWCVKAASLQKRSFDLIFVIILVAWHCKKHGRSVVTRRFLKLKVGGAGMWVKLVVETTPTKRDSGDSSGNPPVTHVATPLIMQDFNA